MSAAGVYSNRLSSLKLELELNELQRLHQQSFHCEQVQFSEQHSTADYDRVHFLYFFYFFRFPFRFLDFSFLLNIRKKRLSTILVTKFTRVILFCIKSIVMVYNISSSSLTSANLWSTQMSQVSCIRCKRSKYMRSVLVK